MLLSNCAICGKKKPTFIKNKELHNFNISNDQFKMKKIINKFLLTGGKFTLELDLKQPGFTMIYLRKSGFTCVPFTKHRQRIKKFREKGD